MIKICNRIIEYSFYSLFLLVPLAFTSATSELFELNKMWLTWGLTIIIVASWLIKMILQRRILLCRTPLDIPIGLFLVSQIISTIFSLDVHTSFWGYYSRFNGGLLSIISYILLYYAFLSNFSAGDTTGRAPDSAHLSKAEGLLSGGKVVAGPARMVKRLLSLSLVSGLIVALWGLPSHFGYDPTCFIFRGTFDVSCWTADFMPEVRIFSTLGQPDWLAAYLAILIPISIAFFINSVKSNSSEIDKKYHVSSIMYYVSKKKFIHTTYYILLTTLFYVDLLYTRARSGFLGIWFSLLFFFALYFWMERGKIRLPFSLKNIKSPLSIFILGFLIITFIIGTPISQLTRFTLEGINMRIQTTQAPKISAKSTPNSTLAKPVESGGTKSGDIRLLVWQGAINTWKANPIFGTGVETFAFDYYKYKPAAQNLTSESTYLYNKAHNEYLNYLATTGIFGLGSYLLMIGYFFFLVIRKISKSEFLISNQTPNSKSQLGQLEIRSIRNLTLALLAGYISILITNFFGFSVVITNIYLFMIPAFVLVPTGIIKTETPLRQGFAGQAGDERRATSGLSPTILTGIFFVIITSCFLLIALFRFWQADIAYAFGYNLDRAGEYQKAYSYLHKAVGLRGGEPVFKDELSVNDAIIAAGLLTQKDKKTSEQTVSIASALAQEAINTSNAIVSGYQNNAVFWKTRVKLFYTLSQVDSRYLPRALDAIEKASSIAPNDANIWYNLGVLYGQNNNLEKGIPALEKTVILKPDYRDAHYALGLFYQTSGQKEKAIEQMKYILDHLNPKDSDALKSIADWSK